MTPAEAAAFLRRYNEWRRTDDMYGMPYPDPREIGEAIDAAIEMIDRLEAAEKDSAHHKALAESALRVAKGWEEKCNSLRAKIAEMEKQGPIGEIVAFGESLHEVSWIKGKLPLLGAKLYALPGAKGEEK